MAAEQPPAKFKVGLVQMAMSADPDANLRRAVAQVAEAKAAGAQLVCLPELFRSQYFAQREDPELFDLAEPIPGPSTEALGKAAKHAGVDVRSEEHTSELQSQSNLVCRLLLEKKKK